MKKINIYLIIVMSIFSIISLYNVEVSMDRKIINISLVLLVLTCEILRKIINKKHIINIVESLIVFFWIWLGFNGIEYILPILLFNIIGEKVSLLVFLSVTTALSIIIVKSNVFNIILMNSLITLYLYEIKRQYLSNIELKEYNRDQRHERNLLENKIMNLEKYMEQNTIITSLKERNYITQKLHDYIGHRITSSIMQLEVTKETLETNPNISRKYLQSAIDNLREGMDEIRDVLSNFKPLNKTLGVEEIKEELLNFQYSTGIKATLYTEGDIEKIDFKIWVIVEENIREALTNATKYSKATEINVSIYVYNRFMRVEIKDNGIGFKGELRRNLGLRGMEERIINIGGRIEFFNNDGFNINMIINFGR